MLAFHIADSNLTTTTIYGSLNTEPNSKPCISSDVAQITKTKKLKQLEKKAYPHIQAFLCSCPKVSEVAPNRLQSYISKMQEILTVARLLMLLLELTFCGRGKP